MKTIEMLITLTYDDETMHNGDGDIEAKNWFFDDILVESKERLILHSNEIGDEIGDVKVLKVY
jgi:hypothetical protein